MKCIFRVDHVTLLEFKMDANMASEARDNALCRKPAEICENKRNSIGYPHIFDNARLIADTGDIARRRPTEIVGISLISHSIAEIHRTSGLQSAILNFGLSLIHI